MNSPRLHLPYNLSNIPPPFLVVGNEKDSILLNARPCYSEEEGIEKRSGNKIQLDEDGQVMMQSQDSKRCYKKRKKKREREKCVFDQENFIKTEIIF